MNLRNLARFVVLVWLPLASFKQYEKGQLYSLFSQKKNLTLIENKIQNVVENYTENVEENSAKKHKNKLLVFFIGNKVTKNFFPENSANLSYLKSFNNRRTNKILTSAHKLNVNLHQSALSLHSSVKNKSATEFNINVTNKVIDPKTRSRRKKAVMNISAEEDLHLLDDYEEEEPEVKNVGNNTGMGNYLGAPCELRCSEKLLHVFCDPANRICECEDKYPVQIDTRTGCEKPKQLGDQCFYSETCSFFDPNAVCMQINHNAICQCRPGFHAVALRKGVKRTFCSEDVAVVSADLSTLLGVATGIAVLTGLICFVLRLFSGNRYPSARHYANTNIAPSLLLSSDNQWINGIPLTVQGRPLSRSSCQRSTVSLTQYSRNKGVLVPASRAGAARAAAILLIPCHLQASRHSEVPNNSNADDNEVQPNDLEQTSQLGSRRHSFSSLPSTTSSQKSMSYSARRFEQENQQREQRAAMRAAREEATRSIISFSPSAMATNGIITSFSKDAEKDPLCTHTEDPPQESEPPAFSVTQTLISPEKDSSN